MKLAAKFGWVDVDGMLDSIGERQFQEWMAFDSIYPMFAERGEVVQAIGFAAMCNAWGAKVKVENFLPFMKRDDEKADEQEQIAKARAIAIKMGAVKV